jgi:hypothetical protein
MIWAFRSILLLPLAVLAGCVTDGTAPLTRAVAPGQAIISIARSNDLLYFAAPVSIELNGAKIASIEKGETYTGGVAPGPAVVSVSAWSSPGVSSYRFTAEPGKTYRFTVAPRGSNFAAGMALGVIGQAIEGGGPFQIIPTS